MNPFPPLGYVTPVAALMGGFTPLALPGLALWLDASDAATLFIDDGLLNPVSNNLDPVGGWADKSGNGRHFTQATIGNKPLYRTNRSPNGLPAVNFNGSGHQLTRPSAGLPTVAPLGIYAVARDADNGAQYRFLSMNSKWNYGSNGGAARLTKNTVWDADSTTPTYAANVFAQATCEFDGTTVTFRKNAAAQNTVTPGSDLAGGNANGHLGSNGGTQFWKGDVAEVVIASVLAGSLRASLESYLVAKWGL